jgi:hypothetical protein
MTLKTSIKDGRGTDNLVEISSAGELILRGIGDNQSSNASLTATNQAFNFFPPLSGKTFVITAIITSSPNNSTLTIFSAQSATSTIMDMELLAIGIVNATTLVVTLPFGGFLSVGEGEFLNATTTVATSNVTIVGFYRPL